MGCQLGRSKHTFAGSEGFSLLELMISVIIITVLMAIVVLFLNTNQKRYRSQQMLAEASQGGRSVLEIASQELQQAGYNPPFQVNKILGSAAGPGFTNLSLPDTSRIFYGSDLIIGNNCPTGVASCDQEEAFVNMNSTVSSSAITATTIPIVLANAHLASEPVYARNYPYPNGILINGSTTAPAISDNKILFFGDILDTGNLYYGEYRLQCPGATPGTFIKACTPGCTTGPFVLTRFMTKLENGGVFAIPASKSAAFDRAVVSPLLSNIRGTCASTAGVTWPASEPDESSSTGTTLVTPALSGGIAVDPVVNIKPDGTVGPPVLWMTVKTYSTTLTYGGMATDVHLYLTIQQRYKDPLTGNLQTRTQVLRTHIVPGNIVAALTATGIPPGIPIDPSTGATLPLP